MQSKIRSRLGCFYQSHTVVVRLVCGIVTLLGTYHLLNIYLLENIPDTLGWSIASFLGYAIASLTLSVALGVLAYIGQQVRQAISV